MLPEHPTKKVRKYHTLTSRGGSSLKILRGQKGARYSLETYDLCVPAAQGITVLVQSSKFTNQIVGENIVVSFNHVVTDTKKSKFFMYI